MIATILDETGKLGQVWLDPDGAAQMDESIGEFLASVYVPDPDNSAHELTVEDGERYIAALPAALSQNTRVWAVLENLGFEQTAEEEAMVESVDPREYLSAAGGQVVENTTVAPIVAEHEDKHLGRQVREPERLEVQLPPEYDGLTASAELLIVSEASKRREFLNALAAAGALKVQQEMSQTEDNKRYAKALCPECNTEMDEDDVCPECGHIVASLVAAAPVHPSKSWFEAEEPDFAMPLTITADGQVMGHAAIWGSCHTGFPGRCTQPPNSPSGYSYFHTGALELDDGSTIPVGRLTFDGPHASMTASRAQAAAHYDNTCKVGAYVQARDGKHGIWISGAIKPGLTDVDLQALRASAPSGDWRRPSPGSPLELVGILGVNVAGFPVPRSLAASALFEDSVEPDSDFGEILALVAAGFEDTIRMSDAFYERQLEVLGMMADGTLGEYIMSPMERRMAMTSAAYDEGLMERERYGIESEEDRGRQVEVLAALTDGTLDQMVMDSEEKRMNQPAAITVVQPDNNEPTIVEVHVNGDKQTISDADIGDPRLDDEVALQVDFLRDHGYYSASPLSETEMTPEEWERVNTIAPLLVENPDLPMSIAVRSRLVRKGLLYS